MEALAVAAGGSVCVRTRRLPPEREFCSVVARDADGAVDHAAHQASPGERERHGADRRRVLDRAHLPRPMARRVSLQCRLEDRGFAVGSVE